MIDYNKKTDNSGYTFVAALLFFTLGVLPSINPEINSEIHSRNNLTNDEVGAIIKKTVEAFNLAEEKILKVKPPDDTPEGPHPDVNKCICRGTGKITHGDGHQTDCPYHGKDVKPEPEPEPEPEQCKCDTDSTYCNCVNAYGKCSCEKTKRIVNIERG